MFFFGGGFFSCPILLDFALGLLKASELICIRNCGSFTVASFGWFWLHCWNFGIEMHFAVRKVQVCCLSEGQGIRVCQHIFSFKLTIFTTVHFAAPKCP